jgi:hypothetical protein
LKKSAAVFGKTARVLEKTTAVLSEYLCKTLFYGYPSFGNHKLMFGKKKLEQIYRCVNYSVHVGWAAKMYP